MKTATVHQHVAIALAMVIVITSLPVYAGDIRRTNNKPYSSLVIQDDDNGMESYWGVVSSPNTVIRKILVVDENPDHIKQAYLQFLIGANPYDPQFKSYIDGVASSPRLADLKVSVNGQEMAYAATTNIFKGWHELPIPVDKLEKGENTFDLTWAKDDMSADQRCLYVYFAIDTSTHHERSLSSDDCGRTFTSECQSPGVKSAPRPEHRGEYLIRLRLVVPIE